MDTVLRPPPPFCFENTLSSVTSGNLSRQWLKWKKSFEIYSKACELSKKTEDVQVSILLHVIGEHCREVYEQFTDKITTIKGLLEHFDKYFLPTKNLTIERHKFFPRGQQEGESVEQYTFELNKLAMTCEFKDLRDDLIRDRLICGLREDSMRERLLRESETLTLQKAVDMCRIAEMSRMQAGCIKQEDTIVDCPNVQPVVHAPRKLPLALRDAVKNKLDEMLEQQVIAKVEGPTDWVNSMTVVKKANGDLHVTVETDHKPLVSIIKKPIASAPARLQRMLLRLQPYTFELVYKPGKYLYVADALSRAVAPADSSAPPEKPLDHLEMEAQDSETS
ncbi:uncharacterized protein LOC134753750 [Cydia strobilella]|uniref:uncharacterized protein LOC134753750 n=1 Tax=Cydia strobilella TaxID=1100964 RepID=UPI003005D7AB